MGILFVLVESLQIVLNYDWPVDWKYFILNYFRNYFKISLNEIIYKMTLLRLPQGLAHDRKKVSMIFKPQNMRPPRAECELNYASKCQTLSMTKFKS